MVIEESCEVSEFWKSNEETANLWNISKAILRRKFIALGVSVGVGE